MKVDSINVINDNIIKTLVELKYENSNGELIRRYKITDKMAKKYYNILLKLLNQGGDINIMYQGNNLLYHTIDCITPLIVI